MKTIFDDFQAKYYSDITKIRNIPIKDIFGNFSFYLIEEQEINSKFDQKISEEIKNSQSLFVDMYISQGDQVYFLINIEQILIIIKSQNLNLLKRYFPIQNPEIYFFENAEENFTKNINIQYNQSNQKYSIFNNINFSNINFNIDSTPNNEFWQIIKKIMMINLLAKSYTKTLQNRIDSYLQNAQLPGYRNFEEIDSNDYILLDSNTKLSYYIKKQSLVVLKDFKQDEKDNFSNISHPLLPRFFGVTQFEGKKSLVIEYINGETLESYIKNHKITQEEDKFDILMNIMVAIEYLHTKFYAYRYLIPTNVIIDHNKTVILTDFDRTKEISSCFVDPEVQNNSYSFKSDVYSFGLMIYYILTSKEPNEENLNLNDIPEKYPTVKNIIIKCIQKNKENRPDFPHIFCDFYLFCQTNNFIRGFSKAIQYFMFAAEYQNDEIAQCHLGFIYLDPNSPLYDSEKAIHYLTLAANQNNLYSQSYLASLYLSGSFGEPGIGKAIHFLSLAANQNYDEAQYRLGCLYFEKLIGFYNIEKAIHFFKEVSSSNDFASNNLGVIYKTGNGVDKDVSKAINYFEDAIDLKDNKVAMFNLAHTYFFEDQGKQDLLKILKLVIEAVKDDVPQSFEFLCLVVLNKFQPLNENEIEKEFDDIDKNSGQSLARRVYNNINNNGLNKEYLYNRLKDINIVYYIHGIDVLKT